MEPARAAVNDMLEAGLLDSVMERAAAGELALTGEGGFLPELVRSVLERGLSTELSEHLGYEKGDPAGRGSPKLPQLWVCGCCDRTGLTRPATGFVSWFPNCRPVRSRRA